MKCINKWCRHIKKIDFIGILLGLFIFISMLTLIAILLVFIKVFYGRQIPVSLEKWSSFSDFLSAIISLANLTVFTFLTVKADKLQKKLTKKQSEKDTMQAITEFRLRKLEEMESCLEYYLIISSTKFSNKILWKNNLNTLMYKINSFRTSAEELFNACEAYNELTDVEQAINSLVNIVVDAKYEVFNDQFKETNKKLLEIRYKLYKYIYSELNKQGE